MAPVRLLHIEDNLSDIAIVRAIVSERHLDCVVVAVHTLAEAKMAMAGESWDVVLLDLILPDSRKPLHTAGVVAAFSSCPVIVITGAESPEALRAAVEPITNRVRFIVKRDLAENPALLTAAIISAMEK